MGMYGNLTITDCDRCGLMVDQGTLNVNEDGDAICETCTAEDPDNSDGFEGAPILEDAAIIAEAINTARKALDTAGEALQAELDARPDDEDLQERMFPKMVELAVLCVHLERL